ncbi:MAG: hypothetical protein ACFWTU_07560 [Leuconostoc mesenteroides]|jgi:sugar phosphate permease
MENTIDPINKRHNSWVTIILLNFFGWIFIYADRTILNPVMPAIQSEFGLNHSQLGLISSLFFLTYTIVQMPFSTLADYFSKKMDYWTWFHIFWCDDLIFWISHNYWTILNY